ncbi:MAG: DNA-processing protein DprA [Candidatus Pacebacteria bacterium]|nr:DNA-processing protein DprA [Candidatus Paceibacterota bacterium]
MEDNAPAYTIKRDDESYPIALTQDNRPPSTLYIRGSLSSTPSIAIVGTRKATQYGKTLAYDWASALARHGYAIVSGLAFGIDASAHQGALDAHGITYAVLAHGLDTICPTSHRSLAQSIISSNGALISEYAPGTPPLTHHFIERNRIISGFSRAVIIIEAPEQSGALSTAAYALKQKIRVFVIPGPITAQTFTGSHQLIRAGARLVSSISDVLFDLEGERQTSFSENRSRMLPHLDHSPILQALSKAGVPCSVDKLAQLTKLTPQAVSRQLTTLLLENSVTEEHGTYRIT